MKLRIGMMVCFFFLLGSAFAEIKATTEDGKAALLYTNENKLQNGLYTQFFFPPGSALAQIKATTENGRVVVLHKDGTWAYFIKKESDSLGKTDVKKIIKEHCEKKWPTDFQMQAYCVKQQSEAVQNLAKGKPSDISKSRWNQIFSECWSKWTNDFQMMNYCTEQQIKGLRQIR